MTQFEIISFVLTFFWGVVWSAAHRRTNLGRYILNKHTWIAVVDGVGVVLLISLLVMTQQQWIMMSSLFFFSCIVPIITSLADQYADLRGEIDGTRNDTNKQTIKEQGDLGPGG